MSRQIKNSLRISFVLMVVLYMVFSFVVMDFNVCNWTEDARGAAGAMWFVGNVFASVPLWCD